MLAGYETEQLYISLFIISLMFLIAVIKLYKKNTTDSDAATVKLIAYGTSFFISFIAWINDFYIHLSDKINTEELFMNGKIIGGFTVLLLLVVEAMDNRRIKNKIEQNIIPKGLSESVKGEIYLFTEENENPNLEIEIIEIPIRMNEQGFYVVDLKSLK